MKELKKAGLKVTIPRVTILELLKSAEDHHFSAEDIFHTLHEQGHDIGLATVYRVLSQFEQAGLLTKLNFENGQAMYEINTGDHHDHLICKQCNKIIEFFDQELKSQQSEIAKANGFALEDHNMVLYGICQNKNCDNQKSDDKE